MTTDADRFRAALVLLAVLLLLFAGMAWGWRRRGARQSGLPAPPAPPADPGPPLLDGVEGVYVGTTTAGDWLDRIVVHTLGRRSPAVVGVHAGGVLVERGPEPALWIPAPALSGVRRDRALAGQVVEEGGLVVLRWRLGETALESGLRLRHIDDVASLVSAVSRLQAEGSAP